MSTRAAEKAYTISEAADLFSVSPSTIRKALRATEGNILRARNIGTDAQPRYRIASSDLRAWWESLPDA